MADEKKAPEALEVSLDEVNNVTGGQGPVTQPTGNITDKDKEKA